MGFNFTKDKEREKLPTSEHKEMYDAINSMAQSELYTPKDSKKKKKLLWGIPLTIAVVVFFIAKSQSSMGNGTLIGAVIAGVFAFLIFLFLFNMGNK